MTEPDFSVLWASFRAKCDRVVVGVAAAFALVAAADGRLSTAETQRFLDVVRGSRLAPTDDRTLADLCLAFEQLTRAILANQDVGHDEALRVLADFASDPMRREIIWSAASAALVADAALDSNEHRVAREIAARLGIAAKRA